MASVENGRNFLDRMAASVIDGANIDWNRYLNVEDKARVIPAETLAERGKQAMLLGSESEPGISTPWHKTRDKVRFRPGKLSIWTGWSRHGKTQMLKQIMLHGMSEGERVLFCSMEEEVIDVWKDMAWIACQKPDPAPKTLDRFTEFVAGRLWLYDQQGTINPKKMIALVRYAAAELKITHLVCDSLMMLALSRDDYEAQAKFVAELKSAAKDTGTHVHLVAHMRKREGKGGEEAPGTLHDIAGGHEIGSIADSVFVVWRDLNHKDRIATDKPEVVLRVDKQRGRVNWTGNIGLNCHQTSRQFVEFKEPMWFWDEPTSQNYQRASNGY